MMFNFLRKRKQNEIQRMIQNGVLENWLDKKMNEIRYMELLEDMENQSYYDAVEPIRRKWRG